MSSCLERPSFFLYISHNLSFINHYTIIQLYILPTAAGSKNAAGLRTAGKRKGLVGRMKVCLFWGPEVLRTAGCGDFILATLELWAEYFFTSDEPRSRTKISKAPMENITMEEANKWFSFMTGQRTSPDWKLKWWSEMMWRWWCD